MPRFRPTQSLVHRRGDTRRATSARRSAAPPDKRRSALATLPTAGPRTPGQVTCDFSAATGTFADPNVANGIVVTAGFGGFTLTGPKAGNYTLGTLNTTTANITPAPATVAANPKSKTYGDVNPSATDAAGGTCSGTMTVGVPHDQGGKATPIGDGPLYNSTVAN